MYDLIFKFPEPGLATFLMDLFILNNGQIFKGLFDCIKFNVLNSEKVMRPGGFPSHVKVYSETSWEINQ